MNVYEIVTNRIIESLQSGVIPWKKPWTGSARMPRNLVTKKAYRGINTLLLWPDKYTSPYWLTFRQALALGGNVRKGEKGTMIVFWKIDPKKNAAPEEQTDDKQSRRFILRYFTVFNSEQCEGIETPEIPATTTADIPAIDICEQIVQQWDRKPHLVLDDAHQSKAFYRPSTDSVHMPIRNRFTTAEHYYSTLFHELVHSTGHPDRLNREKGNCFADEKYSREELVAETGAAFLAAFAGISTPDVEENTVAYIQHWIEALKADSRLIVTAAAQAQKAADMILMQELSNEAEPEPETPASAEAMQEDYGVAA